MDYEMVLSRGTLVTPWDAFECDVATQGGKIASISTPGSLHGEQVMDCRNLSILPGVIDAHVHMRYPLRPDKEDFVSGTMAAAAGGITCVFDMPGSMPIVYSGEVLRRRLSLVESDAYVDFALYGAAGHDNTDLLGSLAGAGAIAFKTFMNPPSSRPSGGIQGMFCGDDAALLETCRAAAATGLVHAVHTESHTICTQMTAAMKAAARNEAVAYSDARPEVAETAAAGALLAVGSGTGDQVHMSHMSTADAVGLAHEYRLKRAPVTVETCPHYLAKDFTAYEEFGSRVRMNPPLRSRQTVEALWKCLNAGMIDIVATDHSPHNIEEKAVADVFSASPGVPGMETLVPVMLDFVSQGRLSLHDIVRLMSYNPSRIFGLYPRKGSIVVGADADFTIVDPNLRKKVRRETMHTKARESALLFDGQELAGWPVMTVVRGNVVMRDGEVTGSRGYGKWVPGPKTVEA